VGAVDEVPGADGAVEQGASQHKKVVFAGHAVGSLKDVIRSCAAEESV